MPRQLLNSIEAFKLLCSMENSDGLITRDAAIRLLDVERFNRLLDDGLRFAPPARELFRVSDILPFLELSPGSNQYLVEDLDSTVSLF